MSTVADLVIASATVRSGKLFVRNRRDFDRQVAQFTDGWELELTIQRRRAARSGLQNRFYWGVVIDTLERHFHAGDLGYTADDIHELCKSLFLPKRIALCKDNGEIVGDYVLGGSTRRLNTAEFYEYVERVRQWAAELGCYIPDPNEEAL